MEPLIPLPPPVYKVGVPLPLCVAPFLEALRKTCPAVPVSVEEETEYGLLIKIGEIFIFCARHCANPAHSCILISIGTTIVPYNDEEKTVDYIIRVVALIENQLNQQALFKLFERLPFNQTLHVVFENRKIQIMVGDFTPDSTTATIIGGTIVHCGIPLKKVYQPNPALMAQFLKIIELLPADTVYVKIQATPNGFVSLHECEGEKFIFLSYNQGVSTKIAVRGIRLFDVETFLKRPTDDLAVIYTSGTPFSGFVGHLEFSCANYAIIKVGEERHTIPSEKWALLKNII